MRQTAVRQNFALTNECDVLQMQGCEVQMCAQIAPMTTQFVSSADHSEYRWGVQVKILSWKYGNSFGIKQTCQTKFSLFTSFKGNYYLVFTNKELLQ